MDHSASSKVGGLSGGGFIGVATPTETPVESLAILLCQNLQDNISIQNLLSVLESTLGVPQSPTGVGSEKASTSNVTNLARLLNSLSWDIKVRLEMILTTVGKLG